jgi:enoyl-CoA hydratase/carnithine racemase
MTVADNTEPLVLRSDDGGLTTLTLNRPAKLNAINPPMFEELRAHIDAIAADTSVGCVVLTGAGRAFCAGHDLESIGAGERARSKHFESETVDAIEALPMPTIAKIRGHCYTGGLELALACDILVASTHAQLGDTHGQWGWRRGVCRCGCRAGRAGGREEPCATSRRIVPPSGPASVRRSRSRPGRPDVRWLI